MWRQEPDRKLQKLFEGIHDIREDHEFENLCEQLRNMDQ